MRRPGTQGRLPAGSLLVLVAVGYLAVQLVAFDPSRFYGYDEMLYLSQVTPGAEPADLLPHRSLGICALLAPVARFEPDVATVRRYLATLSALLLLAVYALWLPALGRVAPLAAALHASTWLTLFYGSEAMPNHFFALLAVGAASGFTGAGGSRWRLVAAALCAVLASWIRTPDAAWLGLGLTVFVLASRRRRELLPALGAVGAGLAVGTIPWLVDAWQQFGGPLDRLRRAAAFSQTGPGFNLLSHLGSTDGPLMGGDRHVPLAGLLWWMGLGMLAARGLGTRDADRATALRAAVTAGLTTTLPYLLLTRGVQIGTQAPVISPRFLMPAYALLGLAAAVGAARLWRRIGEHPRGGAAAGRTVLVAVALIWIGWHAATAIRIDGAETASRDRHRAVATLLRRLADGRPCLLLSQFPQPQVRFASGCAHRTVSPSRFWRPGGMDDVVEAERRVFVLVTGAPSPEQAVGLVGWRDFEVPGHPGVWVYLSPASPGSTTVPSTD